MPKEGGLVDVATVELNPVGGGTSLFFEAYVVPKITRVERQIAKLWDLDSVGVREVDEVHEAFSDNNQFNGTRYSVGLPWKVSHATLPSNYNLSQSRMKGQIRKLGKQQGLLEEYNRIIRDQEELGIIERVPALDMAENVHYLPHHAVVRKDAITTKVRVVYDASAKERKHAASLNDCLHVGPSLNPLLIDILLRFRCNRVVLVGDIEKAFLNVEVDEKDRDYLRFLWVDDINNEQNSVSIFRFCRVVFGLNASPFLLNATIRHHLGKYAELDPNFTTRMIEGFYVDDLVTGGNASREVLNLYHKAKSRMAEGGFKMRKWLTNDNYVRGEIDRTENQKEAAANYASSHVDESESYAKVSLEAITRNESSQVQKVLGIAWNCHQDTMQFNLETTAKKAMEMEPTKRNVLSIIASLFDPLGLYSPVSVSMKILFQDLCISGLAWDELLPEQLKTRWTKWINELLQAGEIRLDRCIFDQPVDCVTDCTLHGFGDASKKAYCAVVYIVYKLTDGSRYARLLTSKTRVAPLKQLTIPRLELMSAVILTRLVETVRNALKSQLSVSKEIYWLDSKTALCWIQNKGEWKQFVRHRVNGILEKTGKENWRHCPGAENPADLGSRGASGIELKSEELWWNGPQWLCQSESEWPVVPEGLEQTQESLDEAKKSEVHNLLVNKDVETGIEHAIDINRCGTLKKLVRVTAWVTRFITNAKNKIKREELLEGELTANEVKLAEESWVKAAQKSLKDQNNFKELSIQLGLVEQAGVLRCQGRLVNSELSMDAKNPIILPKDHRFTELIVIDSHDRVLHSGLRATLAQVREKFWIPRGRQVVKGLVSKCVTCKRQTGKPFKQPPAAALPEFRVHEAPPFSKVGIDFAGPLFAKTGKGSVKVYIALFSCCVTRAIHLELVEDMSVESFRRCLRKFTATRGIPGLIVTDNAKTFQGTEKALRELFNHPQVQADLTNMRTEWRFNLPKAPWWGGFFERMVGCVKQCLRKVLGNASLTFDELVTVLTETECTLNCRPLTYEYNDIGEEVLTPSHLVYGRRINSLPDEIIEPDDVVSDEASCRRRFQYMSLKLGQFCDRWHKEYLTGLREHHRVNRSRQGKDIVQVGDVVTVKEDGKKRNKWRMAVVEGIIKGRDNVVRGAKVRVIARGKHARISRPIQRLYPLEVRNEEIFTGNGKNRDIVTRRTSKRNASIQARNVIKAISMLDS
ncbi:uncharacterized protein LOC110232368 [Exaiptasia diaphana]|uniref:Integrase catalytic domain-containing protein n=1 Tax=Exaiptasia diaphana TaxID=2652724 RepID=A0A913YCB0_EXADI|nr:uncharacterized protein LOC110232368 [Exaiptasia diaphana]